MAVLVTAIHVFLPGRQVVDDRNKSGHDGELCVDLNESTCPSIDPIVGMGFTSASVRPSGARSIRTA